VRTAAQDNPKVVSVEAEAEVDRTAPLVVAAIQGVQHRHGHTTVAAAVRTTEERISQIQLVITMVTAM